MGGERRPGGDDCSGRATTCDDVLDGFGRDGGLWFLIEEVLHELPDDTRSFLLDTCLPERLSSEMAELLSGRDDAGRLLHDLADTNSLVSVFGGEDRSFRYHTLLRGYLVARLADLSGQAQSGAAPAHRALPARPWRRRRGARPCHRLA